MAQVGVANLATGSSDKITVGSKVTIAQDTEIKGEVTIGAQSVVHPKAAILALHGPIVIGTGCIIEEGASIVNRRSEVMRIGDYNYFEVGCRVEAASIGSHNVFEVRSFVSADVAIESFCTVGAGCTLAANPAWPADADVLLKEAEQQEQGLTALEGAKMQSAESQPAAASSDEPNNSAASSSTEAPAPEPSQVETIPDRTVIFGHDSRRRLWSGEGAQQAAAVHVKHLDYLREALPKSVRLKLIQ